MTTLKKNETNIKLLERELAKPLSEAERSRVERLLYLAKLTARLHRRFPDQVGIQKAMTRKGRGRPRYAE